ncbi:hypothetical protein Tco_0859146 [Tanacetum coccineum]|uniref:Uncharacterized protein n=1 Tax=Tanacetum coccineum TaxID=301880 RepID=A0ABQ5BF43_9ASTR
MSLSIILMFVRGLFAPPTIDLSSSGLKEFQQPEFEGYGVKVNKSVSENSSNEIKKTTGALIIEDWVSDCDEDESEEMVSDNVQHKSKPKPEQTKQPRKITVLTKSGIVPISTARQRSSRAAAPLSAARPINKAHDVYYALKYDWKDSLHQTKSVKHIGKSKEVRTLRYLSLVVPMTKVGDEAVHKELGDRMERASTTASSLEAEQDNDNIN